MPPDESLDQRDLRHNPTKNRKDNDSEIEGNVKARSFVRLIAGWRAPYTPPARLARKRGPRVRPG